MKYTLELTFPPSVNNYWINSRGGHHKFLHKKAQEFRCRTGDYLKSIGSPSVGDKPIAMQMFMYPKDRVKRDVDNFNKGIMDALKVHGFYNDDSQCKHISNTMYSPVKSEYGRIVVVVQVIPDGCIIIPSYEISVWAPTDGSDKQSKIKQTKKAGKTA